MRWLPALLIGVVSNLDNLGVGLGFGIRGTKVGAIANLVVAAITVAATAAAVICGHVLSVLVPLGVTVWLGPLIIIAIGITTVLGAVDGLRSPGVGRPHPLASPQQRDVDRSVSWREAIVLGVALSMNNLGMGVGAGVSGMPVQAVIASAGVLSLAAVGGGSRLGSALGRLMVRQHASLTAGVLLVGIGAAMLLSVH